MTEVDRLLTEEARRWRAVVDARTPELDPADIRGRGDRLVRLDTAPSRATGRFPVLVAAGVVALLMLLAGAGVWHFTRSRANGDGGLNVAGAVPDPLTPRNLNAPVPPPATVIAAPKIDNRSVLSLPWKFDSISADGRNIRLRYVAGDGDCVLPAGLVLQQQPGRVAIELVSRQDLSRRACASSLIFDRATITLAMPLGARPLLHAALSPSWSGSGRDL